MLKETEENHHGFRGSPLPISPVSPFPSCHHDTLACTDLRDKEIIGAADLTLYPPGLSWPPGKQENTATFRAEPSQDQSFQNHQTPSLGGVV
ncbi:Abnormal Spindle-Like Microcephaly-Associated Protein [Manis pentadactyla]|nr:Abnormal Spindle-Like Microcephaly-Associated Protein [Manis pentadactyla]